MKFAPNSRAQGMIESPKATSIAQGTIEYLVIIAVVIVIALVVVSLMLTQTSNSQQISSNSNKLGNSIGQGGISVTDSIISSSGDAVISLQNNSGQNLEIQKINPVNEQGEIGGDNFCIRNLSTTQKSECILTNVNELCPCVEGKPTTCKYKITYTTSDGLEKTETFSINSICTPISLYTVTFNAGTGGTINGQTTYTEKVLPGKSTNKITATPIEGYDFNSWSDGTTNPTKTITNVNEDTTINATFRTEEEPIGFVEDCYNDQLDPIPICNCIDLNKVRLDLTANYALQNDIEMNTTECEDFQTGVGFEPIGHEGFTFTGNFDGNSKLIKNLYINQPITYCERPEYDGLFSSLTGSISKIGLVDIIVNGDCERVGGLVGSNNGSIIQSFTTGRVTGQMIVGGLVGYSNGYVSDCYSRADVNGQHTIGGLIGWQYTFDSETWDSYATGLVTSLDQQSADGLIGVLDEAATYSSFYDMNTTGILVQPEWHGTDYGTPKTTAQMTYPYNSENTFEDWSFGPIWANDTTGTINNGYPYLQWQVE